jgi:hypothetical protein
MHTLKQLFDSFFDSISIGSVEQTQEASQATVPSKARARADIVPETVNLRDTNIVTFDLTVTGIGPWRYIKTTTRKK